MPETTPRIPRGTVLPGESLIYKETVISFDFQSYYYIRVLLPRDYTERELKDMENPLRGALFSHNSSQLTQVKWESPRKALLKIMSLNPDPETEFQLFKRTIEQLQQGWICMDWVSVQELDQRKKDARDFL